MIDHYTEVFNRPSVEVTLPQLERRPTVHELDFLPTTTEVENACKSMSSGKTPGESGICGDLLKMGGEQL